MNEPVPPPLLPPKLTRRPGGIGGKIARYFMLSFGATAVISAVVNITAAFQLLEASDEESLGVSRNEIVGTYAALLIGGLLLIWFGLRRKK